MNDTEATQHAALLDQKFREFIAARAKAKAAILEMMKASVWLAEAILMVQGQIRGSFTRWSRIHCRVFNATEGLKVAQAASKLEEHETKIETAPLRLLGVISPIHHAERPMGMTKKAGAASWIGPIMQVRERVGKVIENAGGVDNLDEQTREVLGRQLATLDTLRQKISKPRANG